MMCYVYSVIDNFKFNWNCLVVFICRGFCLYKVFCVELLLVNDRLGKKTELKVIGKIGNI